MCPAARKNKSICNCSFTDTLADGVGGGWVAVRGKGMENGPGEARGELGTVGLFAALKNEAMGE